jgi:hypothetical protein
MSLELLTTPNDRYGRAPSTGFLAGPSYAWPL